MSNFKYNGYQINQIIYGSSATNTTTLNNKFTNMTITTTPNAAVYANTNSSPNTIYYSINGADISTYSMAYFSESVGGGATVTTIPAWCKSIRAVLVGGGGGSQPSTLGTQYDYIQHNSGYNNPIATNRWHRYYENREHKSTPGSGGGGGAFIYISSLNVTGYQTISVSAGSAGSAADSGSSTTMTIVKNSQTSTFTAGGGSGGSSTAAGAAAVTNTIGATFTSGSGQAGAGGSGANTGGYYERKYQGSVQIYEETTGIGGGGGRDGSVNIIPQTNTGGLTYGSGSTAANTTQAVVGGATGTQGFYRIYYLS